MAEEEYSPYEHIRVNPETGQEELWNGARWVPVPEDEETPPQRRQSNNGVVSRVMRNATPDTLINGIQKGDSNAAAIQRTLADESAKAGAERRIEQQQHQQIANRDARVEGDKDAATRAAAQYGQKMSQISGAAGGGAAAIASMNVQDPSQNYSEHRQRSDSQRVRAEEVGAAARTEEQTAIARRGMADEMNRVARQDAQHANIARTLSAGNPDEGEEQKDPGLSDVGSTEEKSNPQNIEQYAMQRIDVALQELKAAGNMPQDLYNQGVEAIKAYANDRNPWSVFQKAAEKYAEDNGIKLAHINDNPMISIDPVTKVETKYGPEGRPVTPSDPGSDKRIKNIIHAIHRRF